MFLKYQIFTRMSSKGRQMNNASQRTPTRATRHSPRIKRPVTPEALDIASELSTSTEKSQITDKTVINLPVFYEELKLPKALYDLTASIEKSAKGKILRNKDVQKNFQDVKEIFQVNFQNKYLQWNVK